MKVGVIGGGAAGLMAALKAAEFGAETTLLERNEKLGKKIYITGKGRCNLTNAKTGDEFFKGFARNGRFMYSAMSFFSNDDMMALLEDSGTPVKVERGDRVFPVSDKASDVTRALEKNLREKGVKVLLNQRVSSIEKKGEGFLVRCEGNGEYGFDRLILCTGGVSYPSTGSDGSGFSLARALGHEVGELKPSLIPILTQDEWPKALSGLSLKNVELTVKDQKKVLFREIGEMLFTHFGVSGPLVLSASAYMIEKQLADLRMLIDMKPGLSHEQLDQRILRDIAKEPKKQMVNLMPGLLPRAMAEPVLRIADIDPETVASQLTRAERERLVSTLKGIPLKVKGFRPVEEAIVTRGGLNIKQVNPSTMESKLVKGLYFAGEMLDVDGFTGGFNLQIAWSTGALAGKSAAEAKW